MGAVYYKFRSAKGYDSVAVHGPFISVWNLKEKIFEAKHLGRGTDYDLLLTNAQTNEDYTDEGMLVPRNTSVLVRRVPGAPRMRIVVEREEESKLEEVSQSNSTVCVADSSDMRSLNPEELEGYDFGNDAFAIPEVVPVQSSNLVKNYQSKAEEDRKVENDQSRAEEDRKIKVLVDMPALDMQWKTKGTFGFEGGFGRVTGDRMTEGHGWSGSLERTTPPQGYICHRCKVPGHFIQHCPTNGNPSYDIRGLKHPTGFPKSMLVETPDGSFALPSGAVAIKPNEAAFVKEIEGPLTRYVRTIPPELHCPLCKEVMKDAILTGKCCFRSFCDKCIRDHIISKSMCACGAINIRADSLIPNKTLRETIDRVLESTTSSTLESAGSLSQVQESNSHTLSATVKKEHIPSSHKDGTLNRKRPVHEEKLTIDTPLQSLKRSKTATNIEKSEVTLEQEPASLGGAPPLAKEKVLEKLPVGEPGKKKREKACKPANAADLQWRTSQNHAALNHLIPFGPSSYNPYWAGMQWGVNEYMVPYADDMQCMGYAAGPFGEGYM
ncbi:E3 ubiquitin ligase PQT3-like isoform X2 [Magnolia sinica]|uniref:E3 ubiquitin ligase PQT3-like isoform X2 n=1 Tax=Magnolia sinica TaxID=86752 RepID=UPI0026595EED|nr:E3 ubiquitin ligase PQT3-like isoform X2 [Magnolia sinica]